jgi:formate C-acetyltransferase
MTGGRCLLTGEQIPLFTERTLADYPTFEEFYESFMAQARKIYTLSLRTQDIFSEQCERRRPAYLLSSMIDGCLEKGKNMHTDAVPYYDYGSAFIGLANVVDSLYAIKRAVYDDGLCNAEELLAAMQANFEGYEELERLLNRLPKYGQEHDEVDALATRLFNELAEIQSTYVNRNGGNGKMVILTFTFAPTCGKIVGATPDGRRAGKPLAHGVTPQSSSMTKGIIPAINSCTAIDQTVFAGGATTMWDMDESWATEEIIRSLMMSFFAQGGQIFQGNVSSVDDLLKAQQNPEGYNHLIVRVGGFSARFVRLNRDLQNEIINRMRHKR